MDDLKLFNGIVSDLFPKIRDVPVDYGEMEQSIRARSLEAGLEDVEGSHSHINKCIMVWNIMIAIKWSSSCICNCKYFGWHVHAYALMGDHSGFLSWYLGHFSLKHWEFAKVGNCCVPCIYPNDVFVATIDFFRECVVISCQYFILYLPNKGWFYVYHVYFLNIRKLYLWEIRVFETSCGVRYK